MLAVIIVVAIVVLILIWVMSTYNNLVRQRNQCEEAFSTMDVYLKQRFDLIPNVVATVKGYAAHEAETLEKVVSMRANAGKSVNEKLAAEGELSNALTKVFAVAESYPDLKANANFINLQNQLSDMETDIANARKYYNGCVKMYNDKCMMVPSNIVAGIFGFGTYELYTVEDEAERKNVKVEF